MMIDAPLILAIDSALGPCSVAVAQGNTILAQDEEPTHGAQSRRLIPMIESVLAQAGVTYDALTAVACTIGPGGFTGIRVGLATARAIALAAGKPLIGLTTLEVIAWGSGHTGDVLAVIDAYRGQHYAQRFQLNGHAVPQSDPLLVEERTVKALGHGALSVMQPPKARDAATLAAHKWMDGQRDFPRDPLYIREPDAKLPARPGLTVGGETNPT